MPVAVVRKFGDDAGGVLATSLAYNSFVAVFPLLLLLVTILGFVLGRSQDAEDAVARSALVEFPIVGDQVVESLEPLRGSGIAVLGFMSWIFLGTRIVLYAAEVNVVLARRLWPRSLVQPPLTDADERALAAIARQQERRPEETVEVGFDRPARKT